MRTIFLILFLITLGVFLLFYNFKYLPLEEKLIKISDENLLWEKEVAELKAKLSEYERGIRDTLSYSFEFKEIFISETSDSLNPVGEAKLKAVIPLLKESNKRIGIIFYGEALEIPTILKKKFLFPYQFGYNKALAVLNYLVNMGFPKEKILIIQDCEKSDKKNVLEIKTLNY